MSGNQINTKIYGYFPMTSNKPHSIRIFLLDGIPDGVRTAEIIMSTIEAIAFRESLLGRVRKELNLARPGIYILVGPDETNPGKMIGYIGESEDVGERLANHVKKDSNDFWEETVVFTSKDDNLTKSHVRYVEAELIKIAQKNLNWSQPNKQNPSSAGILPLADRVSMNEFIEQVKTLAGILGFNIFKIFDDTLKSAYQPQGVSIGSDEFSFYMKGDGYQASAIHSEKSGDFIVKSGSLARVEVNASASRGIKKLREELLTLGVIKPTENGLLFTTDHPFSSPSTAASVIYGGSMNGRINWKTNNGTTYAKYFEERADTV